MRSVGYLINKQLNIFVPNKVAIEGLSNIKLHFSLIFRFLLTYLTLYYNIL